MIGHSVIFFVISVSIFSCRAGVLLSVAECLRGFVIIHEEICSFPEIFLPISSLLQEILETSELPGSLQDIFHEVIELVKKRSDEHHASREPLRMRKKKPEPIKQLNPKFEDKYVLFSIICVQYTPCSFLFCSQLLMGLIVGLM